MREVEFLPQWYSQFLRRRRTVFFQTWMTIGVALGLGLWMFLAERNQRNAETVLDTLAGQIQQTSTQLQQMERLEMLRRQLRQQAEVLTKLGIHVEAGRLITKLSESTPPSVSFLSLNIDTDEIPVQLSAAERASLKEGSRPPIDRRLRVRLQGVAPTDLELAQFLTDVNQASFFERPALTYVRERRESGHVLREFEVTFSINLNSPVAAAGGQ
ncbi:MAG TPA: PilN domain-containing protein [Tepidisphaeraceae bacterium]|jgi:Tfp pilus assembly protein PilN|nr:PilN domain-containing protein [Tepidisphaeraceae bacterium]